MEIVDFDWNSFLVLLSRESSEKKKAYLEKALDCLKKFYITYTADSPPLDPFWMLQGQLELLMEEHNFCDMNLSTDCDVKYKVRPDGIGQHPAGIWVYSHRIEDRRPQIEFLRDKWNAFSL